MTAAFLTQLAQARPDPGGGAAAAYCANVALALLTKVIRLELSRPRQDKSQRAFWGAQFEATRRQRKKFEDLRKADVAAYLAMTRARNQEEPLAKLWRAVEEATRCPWQIMKDVIEAQKLVGRAGEHCRPHLLSDLLVALEILGGALQGAHHIAMANLHQLPDGMRQKWTARLAEAAHQGLEASLRVRSQLLARSQADSPKE